MKQLKQRQLNIHEEQKLSENAPEGRTRPDTSDIYYVLPRIL